MHEQVQNNLWKGKGLDTTKLGKLN